MSPSQNKSNKPDQERPQHQAGFSPGVTIIAITDKPPSTLATGAARTCYASKGIILPDEAENNAELKKKIYQSTATAGHNTVQQHHHITFAIDNISRHATWQFLHAHPFYNSEQVSQRYVTVKPDNFITPPLTNTNKACFVRHVNDAVKAYYELIELLTPITKEALLERFPAKRKQLRTKEGERAILRDAKKKAQEVARYVLPVAASTRLYHTISAITLQRYHQAKNTLGTPTEVRALVDAMYSAVLATDPDFAMASFAPPPQEETTAWRALTGMAKSAGYDESPEGLETFIRSEACAHEVHRQREVFENDLEGRVVKLLDGHEHNEAILARAARAVLGPAGAHLTDEELLRTVLDPASNPHLSTPTNTSTISPVTRAMQSITYTFMKKLSHTADSQDQRHRMVPSTTPLLFLEVAADPYFITPELIKEAGGAAQRIYTQAIHNLYRGIKTLLNKGTPAEFSQYLFPNAHAIRIIQQGNLLHLYHKHTMRQCLNAQEEIWKATIQEAEQIRHANPIIGASLAPPCVHRKDAHQKPYCPEGPRYCGIPVWNLEPSALANTPRTI
ncbi:FAD-dependent thymidylate synthase [Candidatus Woesearchaeota archaeon]|nr:MAG: FAD-dependent thymidylate synthase [Candidatus Woesearchaeota archaeon]